MEMIKYFLKNKRRYLKSNLAPKTQKEKVSIIYRFLIFTKKELGIKNFSEISKNNIKTYQKHLETKGAWSRLKKRYIPVSSAKVKEHISTIEKFYKKIEIHN